MATITVLDADGAEQTVELPNNNGRELAAASRPVALSTEDLAAVNAIAAAIEAIPEGGDATAANQATIIAALSTIAGLVDGLEGLTGTTNSTLATMAGYLDSVETLIGATNTSLATIDGRVDGLEALAAAATPAGANIIGKVGIDQTSDGTTNKVNIDASLKSGTATRSNAASSATSGTILASNANRKGAVIFNSDANALLLDLSGGTAAATRCQVRLVQYTSYEIPAGFTGAIAGIWEADGSGQADVVEFT